ncbi:putative ADP-dependent NAD(P)H-hydrate dehydratase / NAD(P)H-hydrate epimerase [Pillotina sp. SPG140]|jgi:NAD(P)H-hydrate epimerase
MKLMSLQTHKRLLDEAEKHWGLTPHTLIEAAGHITVRAIMERFASRFNQQPHIIALCGESLNAAVLMGMIRLLISFGIVRSDRIAVILNAVPDSQKHDPVTDNYRALIQMHVPCFLWSPAMYSLLSRADIVFDGIAGPEQDEPLTTVGLDMITVLNKAQNPFVLSLGIPSGLCDNWKRGMPIVQADSTFAVEPAYTMLYNPSARLYAGTVIILKGLFPSELIDRFPSIELASWELVKERICRIRKDDYKYKRGVVEIRAGAKGSAGAARIAACGAQSAGAGLVRLIVDEDIYPLVASYTDGIMVDTNSGDRFKPDAILVGPGWGRTAERQAILHSMLFEEEGVPIVIDADAIALSRGIVFHRIAIFTPHMQEFAAFINTPLEALEQNLLALLQTTAATIHATILFKGHVLIVVSPDGRVSYIDGMAPLLATGGTGDLLAGICAAIIARMHRSGSCDPHGCAVAAASLLIEAARIHEKKNAFIDPLELAHTVATAAGNAWLPPPLE